MPLKIAVAILVVVLGVPNLVTPLIGQAAQATKTVPASNAAASYVRLQQPELFTYPELVTLGTADTVSGRLGDKLHAITTTPFLSNQAYYRGARPHRPVLSQLGPSLRLVTWNIERGLELDAIKLLFANTEVFLKQAQRNEAKVDIAQMRQDIEVLKSADVVVLNEVDWGLKRTGYRSVVREVGDLLNMNWAYGVEFVEVDTISLGTERLEELAERTGASTAPCRDSGRQEETDCPAWNRRPLPLPHSAGPSGAISDTGIRLVCRREEATGPVGKGSAQRSHKRPSWRRSRDRFDEVAATR